MWRYVVPLAIFAAIAGLFYRGLFMNPNYVPSPLVGKPAPTFSLPSVTNPDELVSSASLAGRVSLVNVWGTWCVECRHEHGFLVELARAGMPIYGLNLRDDRAAAIDANGIRDVFVALGEPLGDNAWSVRLRIKPLIGFLWLGSGLMALGGLVAITDRRYRLAARQTEPAVAEPAAGAA